MSGEAGTGRRSLAAYLKTPAWAAQAGRATDSDVVLCVRARLARNLSTYPFPGRATERDLQRVAQDIRRAALADTEWLSDLSAVAMSSLSARERTDLMDARRISPELASGGTGCYALLDDEGALSLFVNEEDHLRIQSLLPGNVPDEALKQTEEVETRLARRLTFAHHTRWGYLTTALSNVGTGLRLSALVHLPALAFLGRLGATLEAAHRLGISVRGAHGEGSQAAGDLYQVSNAMTYGVTTKHIAGRVRPVVDYLVAAERAAQQEVRELHSDHVEQAARTAWEEIEQAERLDAANSLRLLSMLRLAAISQTANRDGVPTPNLALFATLIVDLRTGGTLTYPDNEQMSAPPSVRDAIQRPARLRTALRHII